MDAAEVQELLHPQATQRCDLGIWLTQQAGQWGDTPQYQRLVQAHTRFHQCLMAAVNKNDADADLQLSDSSAAVHAAFWDWILHTVEGQKTESGVK